MRLALFLSIMSIALAAAGKAPAHEFWIEPDRYTVAGDDRITAQLRIGQQFEGGKLRFFPDRIARFQVFHNRQPVTVTARLGDEPALNMPGMGDGLLVVVYESTDSKLTYTEWQTFETFLTHKGHAALLAQHRARGLPDTGFREIYRRFGKSLIAAGAGGGADFEVGLRTEIVALANPYTDDLSAGLPVRVLFEGMPRVNAQIELFAREADGAVTVTTYLTDAAGIAVLPVRSGVEYLVDSVVVLPLANDDPKAGPVWQSLWASLTLKIVRD